MYVGESRAMSVLGYKPKSMHPPRNVRFESHSGPSSRLPLTSGYDPKEKSGWVSVPRCDWAGADDLR